MTPTDLDASDRVREARAVDYAAAQRYVAAIMRDHPSEQTHNAACRVRRDEGKA